MKHLSGDDAARRLFDRAVAACGQPLPVSRYDYDLVRYLPEQQYRAHTDGAYRRVTFVMYLNTLPDGAGGETEFVNLGIKVKPREGSALVFRNSVLNTDLVLTDYRSKHAALPCTAPKYVLNCWLRSELFR